MDREYYENLEVPEREISKYPRGFKHFSRDEIFENNYVEFSMLWYKIKRVLFGVKEDKIKHEKTDYNIDYAPIIRKVVYIDEEYK